MLLVAIIVLKNQIVVLTNNDFIELHCYYLILNNLNFVVKINVV